MSPRRNFRLTKRGDSIATRANPLPRERRDSRVTVLAIERALAELGIHAKLSDIVARAQVFENGIIQSRTRRKPERMC